MTGTEQHIDQGEVVARAEVCTVSLEAAQVVASGPLFAELGDPDSMLYKVAAKRSAALPEGNRLGIVPALLTDPTRSGVVVARYLQQEGRLPDQIAGQGADQMVTLWAVEAKKADIPPLLVPEGAEEAAMDVADRMQMRGDGPVIFSRERAGEVPVNPKSRFFITGGARGANRQRIQTAMALKDAHPDHAGPIIATTDPLRILQDGERQAVQAFAPDAKNEQQLFVASAKAEGWEAHPDNIDGSTFLPDGSSYIKMIHQQTAREMFVFAPVRQTDEHGKPQSGVFNAYKSLLVHGQAELGSGIEGEDIVHITSTHYGPMAVMNNLLAVHELRTRVGSFQVVGDNQPATRGPQAHLIEIGKTLDRIDVALQRPALRVGLAAA